MEKRTEEKYLQRYICVSGEENSEENRRGVFIKVHVRKWRREESRRDVFTKVHVRKWIEERREQKRTEENREENRRELEFKKGLSLEL